MRAYWQMTLAGLRSFSRDRGGVFWSFFFPLFIVLIFGAVFGKASSARSPAVRFPVGIVCPADLPPQAAWIPGVFDRVPVIEPHRGTWEAERAELLQGHRRAVVVFPADLGSSVAAGRPATVRIYFDQTQAQVGPAVVSVLRSVLAGMDKAITQAPTMLAVEQVPLSPTGTPARDAGGGIGYLLPGILAMSVMQLGLFSAMPLVVMRERGILKRLRATPLPRPVFVASQVSQRVLIALTQSVLIVLTGAVLFGFRVQGSAAALLGLVLLGVLSFVCIGAIVASLAKTQESAMAMSQVVNMPMMFLSGIFFPLDIMPANLRIVSKALPATYLADAMRSVCLAAPASFPMATDVAVLAAWLVLALVVAARTFRWE